MCYILYKWREVLGAHRLCRHSTMRQNSIFCEVSQVSQNMYGQSLNGFYIFFARKCASFGHSASCRNHYGRLSHLREKYGKSSQDFVNFHFAATQIVTECFWSIYLSIIINGKYRMIAFHLYVLCIGILLSWQTNDIFFLGWQANFGTRISLSESLSLKQINKTAVYLIISVKPVFILLQRSDKGKG